MDIQTKPVNTSPTLLEVQLHGRLDIQSSETVKVALHEAVKISAGNVVVDLQNVNFIDSVGLSALVSGLRVAREKKKDLILIGLKKQTTKVFELTMLNRIFLIYPNLDDLRETI
ncbi:MAG: STAS domain-containing protein [Chloroflexota bacterium]